jgi:hypothetical protein
MKRLNRSQHVPAATVANSQARVITEGRVIEPGKLFVSADAEVTPRELNITRLGEPVAVEERDLV